jgi:hypothetical protein
MKLCTYYRSQASFRVRCPASESVGQGSVPLDV